MAYHDDVSDYFKKEITDLPHRLIRSSKFSIAAKALFALLASLESSGIIPTTQNLCKSLGIHRQTLKKYVNELKDCKFYSLPLLSEKKIPNEPTQYRLIVYALKSPRIYESIPSQLLEGVSIW